MIVDGALFLLFYDVLGLESSVRSFDFKSYGVAFVEGDVSGDCGAVNEDVFTVFTLYKSISFARVVPFNISFHG
jgi:hypothetical protein